MTIDTPAMLDGLNSVIGIPLIPYAGGQIDYAGHAKNIDYLMNNNSLSESRPRVISIAGTSLVHHVATDDQVKVLDIAGQRMDGEGILMAAIVPNPLPAAADLIARLAALQRPPDVYLIMPLSGTYGPAGLYETLMSFAEAQAERQGARFLYYYRRPRDRDMIIRLLRDSPRFVGVKIGTNEDDVLPFIEALDERERSSSGASAIARRLRRSWAQRVIPRVSMLWWRGRLTRSTTRSVGAIMKPRAKSKTRFRPWRISASCKNGPTTIRL